MATYTVSNVVGNPSKYGKLAFDLLEDGAAIAHVTRAGLCGGYISPMKFKFYTTRGEARFQDFCDSLSAGEVCEILLANHNAR